MRLYGVRIFVDDIDRAKPFYGDVLGLKVLWDLPELKAAAFKAGEGALIVEQEEEDDEDGRADLIGRFVGLSLEVDDIQAVHADLSAKGVEFTHPPEKQSWGGWLAHFRDPAGNELTLLG